MKHSRVKIDSYDIQEILSDEELKTLCIKKFNKGSILYFTESINLIIIKQGRAKVVLYENGEEFILYYLVKNNMYILEESCVVEFFEDSEIYVIDARIVPLQMKNINFCNLILSSLVKDIILERKIIKNLVFESCKKRIASFVLDIALSTGKKHNDGISIYLSLSIKELAKFIGSQRQTVSTVFNELIKEHIIDKIDNDQYLISDIERLKEYTYL